MDDQEQFRADLSLLPQVLKLCKALCASGQNDQQLILNAVSDASHGPVGYAPSNYVQSPQITIGGVR